MHATVERNAGKLTLKLKGRFDVSAHRAFRDAYTPGLSAAEVREFEVDLSAVDYLDSSALGMLLMLRERAQTAGKAVALSNCVGTVKQILDIANFGRLFAIR
jgi:HptB-dependent secretion and biofilm anti anti-sigma factor